MGQRNAHVSEAIRWCSLSVGWAAIAGVSAIVAGFAAGAYHSPSYEGGEGPAPANAPGIRHILFVVDDIDASLAGLRAHGGELVGELEKYENSYWPCYVRGSAGIIVELAEKIS